MGCMLTVLAYLRVKSQHLLLLLIGSWYLHRAFDISQT